MAFNGIAAEMNEIASPNSTCAQLAVEPTPLVITATPPKKKGGRPRKEDAAQKEQELSSEAKAKRDKRRQDNLLAAARYRQKKDEAIKILTQGQVLTAMNCDLGKCAPSVTRYQPSITLNEASALAIHNIQRHDDNHAIVQQNSVGKQLTRFPVSRALAH
ncbi:hypothetical protein Tcan_05096 [Toxocara canis]|uniref:BZIP domain-containing protein n=1 Tax=Toxocara canis TaxID=6265 RepID=A0A0B2V631_TOXCA|nr:hypothetical protein Tcan_05096 [Toxocara canis]